MTFPKGEPRTIFHLLPNAHLDPVWLWDWREGFSEGLTTCTTILDLMDEHPELTFIRGESAIYRHIQQTAPKTFDRILRMIEEGRWDPVGGTFIQPDSNLSSTETLCRQFEIGLAWFEKELGVRPRISWQADSFGHTAGWPGILRSFGMEGFMFTRPQRGQFPMEEPAFWWGSGRDNRLLCYRQHFHAYCCERTNLHAVLDITLAGARKQALRNVGVLMGLGNHGGGPSRRHLADAISWGKAHPEVELRYSTLHRLFDAVRAEIETGVKIPAVSGELGYCLRGCYSSVQKFKSQFRTAEASLSAAETSQSIIRNAIPSGLAALDEAWESVLFNSFHDILPGSSIERAMEDQMAWTGVAVHHARRAQFAALNALAAKVDTRVPKASGPDRPCDVPLLVWNPLPRAFKGHVELEASLDYRPLWAYQNKPEQLPLPFHVRDEKGRLLPFQSIRTEHTSMQDLPWRMRAVTALEIPAFGWRVVRMGIAYDKLPAQKITNPCKSLSGGQPWISNGKWSVGVKRGALAIQRGGRNFLLSNKNLRLLVVEDPWGSWGGMNEEPEGFRLERVREEWKLAASHVLESGPERARLWTRWSGANSWVDLTFSLCRGADGVDVDGRLLWNERSARLQLVLPSTGPARCDVPGGVVTRSTLGQVPVARWFTRSNGGGSVVGVATDVLSDVDFFEKESRLTLARASRYANDVPTAAAEKPWQPAVDCGELKFRLNLFASAAAGDAAADALLFPPVTLPVTPAPGELPAKGSFGSLKPANVRLLSAQWADGKLRVRVQNRGSHPCEAKFQTGNKTHSLGRIGPQQIVTRPIPE